MNKTYQELCDEVLILRELSAGTSKCNCSICQKARFWKAVVPAPQFRLIDGQDDLSEYLFNRNAIHHYFCSHCGVKVYGQTYIEELGGEIVAVNLVCLDDASDAELAAAPVTYQDGRNDDFESAPAVIQHL